MSKEELSLKEFKAANPGKDKRHYKKYKKELRVRMKAEKKKEVEEVGIAEKIATVPQILAKHMKPEIKAVKFSIADADSERKEHYVRASGALNEALAYTSDVGNGAILAELIQKAFMNVVDAEMIARDSFRAIATNEAYSRQIIEIAEKEKTEKEKSKAKIKEIGEKMKEYEKKLEEKTEVA